MEIVFNEIYQYIEDSELYTYSSVAKLVGCNRQDLNNCKERGSLSFKILLKIAHIIAPNNPHEKISQWCLSLISVTNIKHSFEYAAITRNISLLSNIIAKNSKETGIIGEYVKVYTLILKYMKNEISGKDIYNEVNNFKSLKDKPLKVLVNILKCYSLYFKKEFLHMLEESNNIYQNIYILDKKESFLRDCLYYRYFEVMMPVHLHLNNLKEARKYASLVKNTNICAKTISDATYIIGMTYLLEDSQECLMHLQESYDIAKTVDAEIEREARLNLDFAKLYLNIKLDPDANPNLLTYEGYRKVATLKKVEEELLQGGDEDFAQLFSAIDNGSVEAIYDCFENFLNSFNLLFSSLAVNELAKRGENSFVVQRLLKLKISKKGDVVDEENYLDDFDSSFINWNGICA
ncbi:AimR family lysis-lysogeny pheromone receptor [Bacillus sp. JJ722]|uniref:AimR family lysis-lysogeny pheromone receptor n=1 Tax=Bacillus sp. JJ722 TaxID=3122973 RepID=UPI003000AAB1